MPETIDSLSFETRAVSLHVAFPLIPVSFIVGISGYALLQFEALRHNIGVVGWFIFWCILAVGLLITALFSDLRVDSEGVSFRTPWVRLLGFKGFPVTFSFDEAKIKYRWGGRLIVINKGNALVNMLLYSFWLMPYKWKESIEIIEKLKTANYR
jgi:hypothetical protein